MAITAKQIREIELPTAVRGYDKKATKELLESAAKALSEAIAERDELRRKLDENLKDAPVAAPVAVAAQSEAAPPVAATSQHDLESIGAALLTAQRAGDRLLEEARQQAVQIKSEAEYERHAMLKEAQADVEGQLSGVKQRLEAMTEQEANLRSMISDRRTELTLYVHKAVDHLATSRPTAGPETLENVLRDRVQDAHVDGYTPANNTSAPNSDAA